MIDSSLRFHWSWSSWLLVSALLAGCGSNLGSGEESSSSKFPFEPGPTMFPGENCRSCHGAPSSQYPSAPAWSVAGTVFEGPDSDTGAMGVTVIVRDAKGEEFRLVTNEVGNFYLFNPVAEPYSVALEKDGVTVTMPVPPPTGGCNACHADPAVGDAPGKLYVPPSGEYDSIATCDGDHTVTIGAFDYDCAPYVCIVEDGNDRCAFSCESDGDCVDGAACSEGRCVPTNEETESL